MRPQLDLCPGRIILALSAASVGSVWTAPALAGVAAAPAPPSPTVAPGLLLGGLAAASDDLVIAGGGPPARLGPGPAGAAQNPKISASMSVRNLLVGRRLAVSGVLRPRAQSHVVALQEHRGSGWVTIARGATSRSGVYRLGYRPLGPGTLALRVRSAGDRVSRPALGALGAVNVYRRAGASWYGAGGGPLACGGTLTASRLGVAHRTLPCGTMVSLHLGNRTVRVPVIDRGPYVAGREYDLTPATKRALGFGDTGEIWATR